MKFSRLQRRHPLASVGIYFETVRCGSSGIITQNPKKNLENFRKNRDFEANKIAPAENFRNLLT